MSAAESGAGRSRGILDDHVRVGKRLKHPISTFKQIRQTSYIDEIIPEIVHIGMLFDAHGYHEGLRLCECLFTALRDHCPSSALPFVSNLQLNDKEAQAAVIDRLKNEDILDSLRLANSPFALIKGWPLDYLGYCEMDEATATFRLEACVARLFDKQQTPACAAMATIIYWQGMSGKLHYPQGMPLPNLNAIVMEPKSQEAAIARSHVRASIMTYWALGEDQGGIDPKWASSFWHKAAKLSPCAVHVEQAQDAD